MTPSLHEEFSICFTSSTNKPYVQAIRLQLIFPGNEAIVESFLKSADRSNWKLFVFFPAPRSRISRSGNTYPGENKGNYSRKTTRCTAERREFSEFPPRNLICENCCATGTHRGDFFLLLPLHYWLRRAEWNIVRRLGCRNWQTAGPICCAVIAGTRANKSLLKASLRNERSLSGFEES